VRVLVPFSVFLSPDVGVELVVLMVFIAKGHRSSLNSEASYPDMFLGAFAEFEKVALSFILSVGLSVHPSIQNNSVPSGRIFMKFDI
jgi:hypothetical protein